MNYDDLTPEEKDIWDTGYAAGHDVGYEDGWNEYAENSATDDYDQGFDEGLGKGEYEGFKSGFEKGVLAERQRVQDILQMMFDSALNMGQGNKAVQYRQMMELLTPVEIKPYTEEDF